MAASACAASRPSRSVPGSGWRASARPRMAGDERAALAEVPLREDLARRRRRRLGAEATLLDRHRDDDRPRSGRVADVPRLVVLEPALRRPRLAVYRPREVPEDVVGRAAG